MNTGPGACGLDSTGARNLFISLVGHMEKYRNKASTVSAQDSHLSWELFSKGFPKTGIIIKYEIGMAEAKYWTPTDMNIIS